MTNNAAPHVLIVEDDYVPRGTITNIVVGMGLMYSVAQDGREALVLIERQVFDLIILDIGLPEIDGLSVLDRAREIRSSLEPVIVLTGYNYLPEDAQKLKVFALILKAPLPVNELRSAIRDALNLQS